MSKPIALLALTLFACLPSFAQKQWDDAFAPVPAEVRGRLIERLRAMLEYERTDDRGALYDMTFGPLLKAMSREEFVNLPPNRFDFKILGFTPRLVDQKGLSKIDGANWRIVGEARVRKADGTEDVKDGIIYAQFRAGEWYLTGVLTMENRQEIRTTEIRAEP